MQESGAGPAVAWRSLTATIAAAPLPVNNPRGSPPPAEPRTEGLHCGRALTPSPLKCLAGLRLAWSRLDQLLSTVGFWFAWKGFYPETLVWKP